MRNLENVSSKIWLTGFFNFEASTHGRQFILLKEDCSPFYVRNSRIESWLINVKGKDPLVVHRCYSSLPKPIDTSSNMFKSLPNLKKKTLDRSHDEFQLASLLYRQNSTTIKSQQLFRTPQTTFITNFSKLSTP